MKPTKRGSLRQTVRRAFVILVLGEYLLLFLLSGWILFKVTSPSPVLLPLGPERPSDLEPRYHPDYILQTSTGYELQPNVDALFDGSPVRLPQATRIRTNEDGIRESKTYPLQKQETATRMVALGDSYTFGWGVELEESWPKVLERRLNEASKDRTYEVLNFGVPGYNTALTVALYQTKGAKYAPDYILLPILDNDIENISTVQDIYETSLADLARGNLSTIEKERRAGVDINRYRAGLLENLSQGWPNIERPPISLAQTLHNEKVLLVYLDHSDPLRAQLTEFSRTQNWSFFALHLDLGPYGLPYDGHPDREGHRAIADAVFLALPSSS